VKSHGLTVELPLILQFLSLGGVAGIRGVAVKCVDITRNTRGVGGLLDEN
jgi:hypothetical protein